MIPGWLAESKIFAESWNVAFRRKNAGKILEDTTTEFIVIKNSLRFWAADPFVIEHEGRVYVFAELYDYLLRRGILGFCEIRGDRATKWKPIIRKKHHLSYPCLMKYQGRIFMMPESCAAGNLTIYESTAFPEGWKKCAQLRRDTCLADTTPLPCADYRYAVSHRTDPQGETYLCLLDLMDERNDSKLPGLSLRSRPAGHIFRWKGNWIRPAQLSEEGDEGYGKGLIFYKCSWTENAVFQETEIRTIRPDALKYSRKMLLDGMHTYNTSEHYEVIDIKTRRLNLLNLMMRIAGKVFR